MIWVTTPLHRFCQLHPRYLFYFGCLEGGDDFFSAPKPKAAPAKAETKPSTSKGGLFGEEADDDVPAFKSAPKPSEEVNKKGAVIAALTKEEKKEEPEKKAPKQSLFNTDDDNDPLFSSSVKKVRASSNLDKLKASLSIDPKAHVPGAAPPQPKVVPTAAPSFEEPRMPSFPPFLSFFLLSSFFFFLFSSSFFLPPFLVSCLSRILF